MLIADNGKLYLIFHGEKFRIGQQIIQRTTTATYVPTSPDSIFIDYKRFREGITDYEAKNLPMYTRALYPEIDDLEPIPFDFIQIQDKGIIYADGSEIKYIGDFDDEAHYILLTNGIILSPESLKRAINYALENVLDIPKLRWNSINYLYEALMLLSSDGINKIEIEEERVRASTREGITLYYEDNVLCDDENVLKNIIKAKYWGIFLTREKIAKFVTIMGNDSVKFTPYAKENGNLGFKVRVAGIDFRVFDNISITSMTDIDTGRRVVFSEPVEILSANRVANKHVVFSVKYRDKILTYYEPIEHIRLAKKITFESGVDLSKVKSESNLFDNFRVKGNLAYAKVRDKLLVIGTGEFPEDVLDIGGGYLLVKRLNRKEVLRVVKLDQPGSLEEFGINLIILRDTRTLRKEEFAKIMEITMAKVITGTEEPVTITVEDSGVMTIDFDGFTVRVDNISKLRIINTGRSYIIFYGDDYERDELRDIVEELDDVLTVINQYEGVAKIFARDPYFKDTVKKIGTTSPLRGHKLYYKSYVVELTNFMAEKGILKVCGTTRCVEIKVSKGQTQLFI